MVCLMCFKFATMVKVIITNKAHELHLLMCTDAQAPIWFG